MASDKASSNIFALSEDVFDLENEKEKLKNPRVGAIVTFEGWVRDHAEGKEVRLLEYQVYKDLACSEGINVVQEAIDKFDVQYARCIHRYGQLQIGDVAVWIGVASAHRRQAFDACSFIIDSIKIRLPIWKRETYKDGRSDWINCHIGDRTRSEA